MNSLIGFFRMFAGSVEALRRAAMTGDAEAAYRLGRMYEAGLRVGRDDALAAMWHGMAADLDHAGAQYRLGMMCLEGRGLPRNDDRAFRRLRRAAEQNHARAQLQLARLYAEGRGVAQNGEEAARWRRRAVEPGRPDVLLDLLLRGDVPGNRRYEWPDARKDQARPIPPGKPPEARKPEPTVRPVSAEQEAEHRRNLWNVGLFTVLFALALGLPLIVMLQRIDQVSLEDQVLGQCQYRLGQFFERGPFKNEERARDWYTRAVFRGHEKAHDRLALMAERRHAARDAEASELARAKKLLAGAKGKPQDKARAVALYRKAAEQGNADALFELGLLDEQDHPKNVGLYLRSFLGAAFRGHEGARERLAENSPTCVRVLETLKPEAERSRTDSQNLLAVLFQMGYCVPQSDEQAAFWYRKAAEQGNATAQSNLGLLYKNGWGLPRDEEQALTWYRKAAAQGDEKARKKVDEMERGRMERGDAAAREGAALARAAAEGGPEVWFRLAVWHELGRDGRQDYEEAARWYRRAAESGHADAQYHLAGLCERGWGLPKDEAQAREWLRRAVEQGHEGAKRRLAGEPKGLSERAAKYHREAELGDAEACYRLAWKYRDGEGAPQDDAQALVWFRKAAEQGHEGARSRMEKLEENLAERGDAAGDTKALSERLAKYHREAELGDANACFKLAQIYRDGEGVPKDDAQALAWFRRAAEQGHVKAQLNTGWMYQHGRGTQKDEAQALAWYRKAAAQGDEPARIHVKVIEENRAGR